MHAVWEFGDYKSTWKNCYFSFFFLFLACIAVFIYTDYVQGWAKNSSSVLGLFTSGSERGRCRNYRCRVTCTGVREVQPINEDTEHSKRTLLSTTSHLQAFCFSTTDYCGILYKDVHIESPWGPQESGQEDLGRFQSWGHCRHLLQDVLEETQRCGAKLGRDCSSVCIYLRLWFAVLLRCFRVPIICGYNKCKLRRQVSNNFLIQSML